MGRCRGVEHLQNSQSYFLASRVQLRYIDVQRTAVYLYNNTPLIVWESTMFICEECNKDIGDKESIGTLYEGDDTWAYCSDCRTPEMTYIDLVGNDMWEVTLGAGYVLNS